MEAIKIGFVPAHREPFDENWAAQMRRRCLDAFSAIAEYIHFPPPNMFKGIPPWILCAFVTLTSALRQPAASHQSSPKKQHLRARAVNPGLGGAAVHLYCKRAFSRLLFSRRLLGVLVYGGMRPGGVRSPVSRN